MIRIETRGQLQGRPSVGVPIFLRSGSFHKGATHIERSSLTEPLPVLAGPDEGLDHLSVYIVPAVLFELPEPEVSTLYQLLF